MTLTRKAASIFFVVLSFMTSSFLPSAEFDQPAPGRPAQSKRLYASAAATNGSAFAGLNANTAFYNLTLSLAMFIGRFFVIIPVLAIAGALAAKRIVPRSAGTLPTGGGLFVGFLSAVILIVGGLTFFPAIVLGPVADHFALQAGTAF